MAQNAPNTIRKAELSPGIDFDDQLWPINFTILLTAAFAAGIVIARFDFDLSQTEFLKSGFVPLGGVLALFVLLICMVRWLDTTMIRRIRLCIMVSLLVHLWLATYLHFQHLVIQVQREPRQGEQIAEEAKPIALPRYFVHHPDRPETRQSFEKPVETKLPEKSERELSRRPVRQQRSIERPRPVEPDTPPHQATLVRRESPELDAETRADLPKQTVRSMEVPRDEIEIPQPVEPLEPIPPVELQPEVAAPQRQLDDPLLVHRTEEPMPERVLRPAGQPREVDLQPELVQSQSVMFDRQVRQVAAVLPAEVEQPVITPATDRADPSELAIRAQDTSLARPSNETALIIVRQMFADAILEESDLRELQSPATRRVEEESPSDRPSTLVRRESGIDLPSATTIVENVAMPAAIGGAAPSRIEVASTVAVERSDSPALKRENSAAAGAAEFAVGSSKLTAQVGQPRAAGDEQPAVTPNSVLPRIARSSGGLAVPSTPSPTVTDVPLVAAASGGGDPAMPIDARATPIGRGGSMGTPERLLSSTIGSGPAQSPGMSGRIAQARIARVTGEATMPSEFGGGTPLPARKFGRAFSADASVEIPLAASGPASGGIAEGPELDAQVSGFEGTPGGLPGALRSRSNAGALTSLTDSGPPLAAMARRALAAQQDSGRVGDGSADDATMVETESGVGVPAALDPSQNLALGAGGAAPNPGGQASNLPLGSNPSSTPTAGFRARHPAAVELPIALVEATDDGSIRAATGEPGNPELMAGSTVGGPARQEGGLSARIPAMLGSGGSYDSASSSLVRIPGRRARFEDDAVRPVSHTFLVKSSPGTFALNSRVSEVPEEAFQQRAPNRRFDLRDQDGTSGPTEGSESAVELGLDFLARNQFPDGHWSLDEFPEGLDTADASPGQIRADTAATGLALLAFLGAGYTHVDNKYLAVVRKGVDWLLENQQPNGQLFSRETDVDRAGRIYGHGIAAIALCEAYGMTKDPRLREPATGAIEFIQFAQHPTEGGWRYTKDDLEETWRKESDTSVSGWQLMALKSAQMAGLEVPQEAMDRVRHWLDLAQSDGGARYVYNPNGITDQQRSASPAMTAEGLLMRMYLGWDRNSPALARGADFLKENLPDVGTAASPLRDSYYWYYATQVMFQMQGDYWTAWNNRLRPMLEESQVEGGPLAGSWHPDHPVLDRWAHSGGRHYITTLNLLMLEVYYRHLPLFKSLRKDTSVAGL